MKSKIVVILIVSFLTTILAKEPPTTSKSSPNQYPLHEAAFNGDINRLRQLLEVPGCNVNGTDTHGNTPLHLAVMMERVDVAKLLTQHGASVSIENSNSLTPIGLGATADMLTVLVKKQYEEVSNEMKQEKQNKVELLNRIDDFKMELKISIKMRAFGVERNFPIIPPKIWKIYKRETMLRLDLPFPDPDSNHTIRHLSFILVSDAPSIDQMIILLDRDRKTYMYIKCDKVDEELKDIVNGVIKVGNPQPRIITKNLTYKKKQRQINEKMDGKYSLKEYEIKGFKLSCKSRDFEKSNNQNSTVSWEQYIGAESTKQPLLKKERELQSFDMNCSGKITVAENFPLKSGEILGIFKAIAPIEMFQALYEILTNKLGPNEFPVGIQVPVTSIIKARYPYIPAIHYITFIFVDLRFQNYNPMTINKTEFDVPKDYTEDLKLFDEL